MDIGSVSDWSARTLLLYIALRHTYGTLASTVPTGTYGTGTVGRYHSRRYESCCFLARRVSDAASQLARTYTCLAARLSNGRGPLSRATSTSLHPARGPSAHYSHARCSSPRARRTQQSTASDLPGQARSGGRRRAAKGPTESSTCTSAPRRLTEFSAKICHARCLEFAQLPLFVVFMEQDRKFSQAPAVQPRGDGCRRV